MIVGDRVAERLAHAGISQGELARRVGVSQPTINNLINRSKKGSTHLHRIARELGTTPDYLEGKVDDPDAGADTGLHLSSEEREWLDLFQLMTPEQRRNLRSIARDMTRGNSPSTYIHDKRQDYRAPDQA